MEETINNKIYTIRGVQVMFDSDLAKLYGVETKSLNRAVKRNIDRFPSDFMFQLNENEINIIKSQFASLENEKAQICANEALKVDSSRYQFGTLKNGRGKNQKYLPYVFTEQGVAMLSSVLKSQKAIEVNIQIIRAFIAMRRFIASNAQIFQRLDSVEIKQLEYQTKTNKNFEKVFEAIEDKSFQKKQGIFFEGQIFDAYKFVSDLIRTAKFSIILIDNYIDDSVLILFSKREKDISVTIYTSNLSKQLELDLAKYNSQYPKIEIKEFRHSHDRFLIIDNQAVYHSGASLKDLGKKWSAFSKFDKEAFKLLDKLGIK